MLPIVESVVPGDVIKSLILSPESVTIMFVDGGRVKIVVDVERNATLAVAETP